MNFANYIRINTCCPPLNTLKAQVLRDTVGGLVLKSILGYLQQYYTIIPYYFPSQENLAQASSTQAYCKF